jgi:hypothetical protein
MRSKAPPGEHVRQTQDGALVLVEQRRKLVRIDSGHGNMGTDAIDNYRHQYKTKASHKLAQSGTVC